MSDLPFQKGHGLGNDYIVVDAADLPWPMTAARASALCDRNTGVGGDGVLLVTLGDTIGLRIYNPDGTQAEKSGNGLRILAAYLYGRGLVGDARFSVLLPQEAVAMRVIDWTDTGVQVTVEMGSARFGPGAVAFTGSPGPTETEVRIPLAGGFVADATLVSTGNPHCVVFPPAWSRDDFLRFAPVLATSSSFEHGTNVQFVRTAGPSSIDVWVWERGAGETLASGSSACACAAAVVGRGLLSRGEIEVRMRGGSLLVEVRPDDSLRLTGPACITFSGHVEARTVEAWRTME